MKRIYIVIGSVRPHWLGRRIAQWVRVTAKQHTDAAITIVDAEDINLGSREVQATKDRMRKKYDLAEADGYIIIAPEYESGKTRVIDRVIEALKQETSNKPVAFVSYGQWGGYKLVETLRAKVKRNRLAPIRNAVHIGTPWDIIDQAGELHDNDHEQSLQLLIKQLTSWIAVNPSPA